MDFNDSLEDAEYRRNVRAWLDQNVPKKIGSTEQEKLAAAKDWQAKKAAVGYGCITWPTEWGGPGGTAIQNVIFTEEESNYQVPPNPFRIGLGMCLPTVMAVGDEDTKKRFVGSAMRGEEIWCQLFSEPSAGSDLGASRTRAVRSEGTSDWIINGQKVWTTLAQYSDYGIVICRTDPNVPKHKGLTMFWIDMRDRGVKVTPIRQMSGDSEFNEVFLADVRVKDSQRLGAVGDGWKVSLITLMTERLAVGKLSGANWAQFLDAARRTPGIGGAPALKDQSLREKLADWYVQDEAIKHTRNRAMTAISKGQIPGPENSISKIIAATKLQELSHTAVEMLDQYGIVSDPYLSESAGQFHATLLTAPGLRIAGGTDEILRNILAERVLGLPGEIRVDKDVAFRDVPTGR